MPTNNEIRNDFFQLILGDTEGILCISRQNSGRFRDDFFYWPRDKEQIEEHILINKVDHDLWFCPHLLTSPRRIKENVVANLDIVWADLDECHFDKVTPKIPIVVETSDNRFQGLWRLHEPVSKAQAEEYSRKIAYTYESEGADKSGWDLTQLLRVPYSFNFKYGSPAPLVKIIRGNQARIHKEIFDALPAPAYTRNGNRAEANAEQEDYSVLQTPFPEEIPDAVDTSDFYKGRLSGDWWMLYDSAPEEDADWSKLLWQFLHLSFEAGMSTEEVYAVASMAACNKWKRDGRSLQGFLWPDVLRAAEKHDTLTRTLGRKPEWKLPDFPIAEPQSEFLTHYVDWCSKQTDAPRQYHEAVGMFVLSAALARNIRIPLSFGTLIPNLWTMLLGDTTLSRKTTCMSFGIDLLEEIENEVIMSTEGTAEGILRALSARADETSVFYRDEFTGLMSAVSDKKYMSGMLETFTQLYDGRSLKKTLSREAIIVPNPVFLILAGGVKTKMFDLLNEEHVMSGFLPRFCIATAENDFDRIKPLGVRREVDWEFRQKRLLDPLAFLMKEKFVALQAVEISPGNLKMRPGRFQAIVDEATLEAFNKIHMPLLQAGTMSPNPDLYVPTIERACFSMLKLAVCFAAERIPENDKRLLEKLEFVVLPEHIYEASWYLSRWLNYSLDVVKAVGASGDTKLVSRALQHITRRPGIQRSEFMRNLHMSSFDVDRTLRTLVERNDVTVTKGGGGQKLWPNTR